MENIILFIGISVIAFVTRDNWIDEGLGIGSGLGLFGMFFCI